MVSAESADPFLQIRESERIARRGEELFEDGLRRTDGERLVGCVADQVVADCRHGQSFVNGHFVSKVVASQTSSSLTPITRFTWSAWRNSEKRLAGFFADLSSTLRR